MTGKIAAKLRNMPHVVTILSVEGYEETNDYLRGEGVFVRIMAAMDTLREANVIFGFSTAVHKDNVDEVVNEKYLDFMLDKGCFFGGFLPYVPVGSHPRYGSVCDADEVKNYFDKLDVISRGKPLLILKEGFNDGTAVGKGCGAAHSIHFTSKGEAEPCTGIEFFTHSIEHASVSEIFRSDFFRDIRDLHKTHNRKCLTIVDPEGVLRIVEKHNARPTHDAALEHLKEYIAAQNG
jgi:MoaA/NifB/PqqE/SkfB family radical SAM enzyme